jgi:hypothetical protein
MRCTSTAGNGTAMNKRRAIIIVLVMLGAIESREVAYAQKLKVPSDSSRGTNSSNLYSADSDKSSDGNHKEPLGSINKQDLRGNQAVTQSSHQKGQPSAQLLPADASPVLPNLQLQITPPNVAPTGISGAGSGRSGSTSHAGKQSGSNGSKSGGEHSGNRSAGR